MVCPHCGAIIPDDAVSCENCGIRLDVDPELEGYIKLDDSASEADSSAPTSTGDVLKKTFSSVLFIVCASVQTALILYNFISLIFGWETGSLAEFVMKVYRQFGGVSFWVPDTVLNAIGTLIVLIPVILIAIGLWLTFFSAIKKDGAHLSPAGLVVVKVSLYIMFVAASGALVYSLILLVNAGQSFEKVFSAMLGEAAYEKYLADYVTGYASSSTGLVAVISIAVILLYMFSAIFFFKTKKTVNAMIKSAKTDTPVETVSMFIPVLLFSVGFVFLISGTVHIIFAEYFAAGSDLGFAACLALYGFFILYFRREMKRQIAHLREEYKAAIAAFFKRK